MCANFLKDFHLNPEAMAATAFIDRRFRKKDAAELFPLATRTRQVRGGFRQSRNGRAAGVDRIWSFRKSAQTRQDRLPSPDGLRSANTQANRPRRTRRTSGISGRRLPFVKNAA